MRTLLLLMLLAGCEMTEPVLDGGSGDLASAAHDLGATADLLIDLGEDLAIAPEPRTLRFAENVSADLLVLYERTGQGPWSLVALAADHTELQRWVDVVPTRVQVYPGQLMLVGAGFAPTTGVWWPALGASSLTVAEGGVIEASADGQYLAIQEGSVLRAGPRSALETLPGGCGSARFSPVTDHLFFVCAGDLYRLGRDQPASSATRLAPAATLIVFTSDGEHLITATSPPGGGAPRLVVASTALSGLDEVVTQGVFSPAEDKVAANDLVVSIPGHSLVEFVSEAAGVRTLRELDWSVPSVRSRSEIAIPAGAGGYSFSLGPATRAWFSFRTALAWTVVPISGPALAIVEGGWGNPGLLAAPTGAFAIFARLQSAFLAQGFRADLTSNGSCSPRLPSYSALVDDGRTLHLARSLPAFDSEIVVCSATGLGHPLADPQVSDFRYHTETHRLHYIQGGALYSIDY